MRKLRAIWHENQSILIDFAVVIVSILITGVLVTAHETFQFLESFGFQSQHLEFRELFGLGVVATIVVSTFALRRVIDLRQQQLRCAVAEAKAQRLASHDPLTGLPNRKELLAALGRRTSDEATVKEGWALFVVSVWRLNTINKIHGYAAGDHVLWVLGQRLTQLVDNNTFIARFDHDKLAILTSPGRQPDSFHRLARAIVDIGAEPVMVKRKRVMVHTNVGIAIYPDDADGPDALLQSADLALSKATSAGCCTASFFAQSIDKEMQARLALERELGSALRKGDIVPYYQPFVDLSYGKTAGYEVLARWKHRQRGLLAPSDFISIVEDANELPNLTRALLRQACVDVKKMPDHPILAINIAPSQFVDPGLPQMILNVLTDTSFPPYRLEIELTEDALVRGTDYIKQQLQTLKNFGIMLALDDFGTGYSGLTHLREFPFDKVKIDQRFVTDMLREPRSAQIVEGILHLCKSLRLKVCAEGVESHGVMEKLQALGCDIGQGFLFGKPTPASELTARSPMVLASKDRSVKTRAKAPKKLSRTASGRPSALST